MKLNCMFMIVNDMVAMVIMFIYTLPAAGRDECCTVVSVETITSVSASFAARTDSDTSCSVINERTDEQIAGRERKERIKNTTSP